VEHCEFLSWFCGSESHEQDGEMLMRGAARAKPAPGDPAMALGPPTNGRTIVRSVTEIGSSFAAG
jgi:hypothetical protein